MRKAAYPAYLEAFDSGELEKTAQRLVEKLDSCQLCPRRCRVNRLENEKGFCKTGRNALLSSFSPHFGEESPLVGSKGSGTIFFTFCNLRCCFCQNYDISHEGIGEEIPAEGLARVMLHLQKKGCHNINLVSPSHVVAQIIEALLIAAKAGLNIPLVYNTGGYDSQETIRYLDGIVDIYMPDVKFSRSKTAETLAAAPDYPNVLKEALAEMHRQTGDLSLDETGLARKGLLIRHLVMPGQIDETEELLRWIAGNISKNSYLNIMDQYRPCGTAYQHSSLSRKITNDEFQKARDIAKSLGLYRLDARRPYRISLL